MAKPFTRIDNDLLDGLAKLHISGNTFRVLFAIIRSTVSFHKDRHELSNGYLMNATGLNERSVIRAVQELKRKGIIEIAEERSGSRPRTLKIYTDKIVILTKAQGGTDKNVSISTDKSDSMHTDKNVREKIKEEKKEKKEEKNARAREASLSNEQPTFEELAALSQQENDEEEEGYEYL